MGNTIATSIPSVKPVKLGPTIEMTSVSRGRKTTDNKQIVPAAAVAVGSVQGILSKFEQNLIPMSEHEEIPDYLKAAESQLYSDIKALKSAVASSPQNTKLIKDCEKNVEVAFSAYNIEAAHFLHQATKSGREDVDPPSNRLRINTGNLTAAVVANLGFSIPAAMATSANLIARNAGSSIDEANTISEGVFGGAVALMSGPANNASSYAKATMGGTSTRFMMASDAHAKTGPYKQQAGELAEVVTSTFVYSAVRAALVAGVNTGSFSEQPTPANHVLRPAAAFAIAAVSALVTGAIKDPILNTIASNTIKKNDADTAAQQPIESHNRSHANGVRLNNVKNPYASTNGALGNVKSRNLTINTISGILAAVPMTMIGLASKDASQTFAPQFGKIFTAFSAFFVAKAAVTALATKSFNHPKSHASIITKSSEDTQINDLRASTLTLYQNSLKQLGHQLTSAKDNGGGRTADNLSFETTRSVFGPKFLDIKPVYTSFANDLVAKARAIRQGADNISAGEVESDSHRNMNMIADKLDRAAESLNAVSEQLTNSTIASSRLSTGFGKPPASDDEVSSGVANSCCGSWYGAPGQEPDTPAAVMLGDARKSLFDAQALVIRHNSPSVADSQVLSPLMPIFAGLEGIESQGKADKLINDVYELSQQVRPDGRRGKKMRENDVKLAKGVMERLNNTNTHNISPTDIINSYKVEHRGEANWKNDLIGGFNQLEKFSARSQAHGSQGMGERANWAMSSALEQVRDQNPIAEQKLVVMRNILLANENTNDRNARVKSSLNKLFALQSPKKLNVQDHGEILERETKIKLALTSNKVQAKYLAESLRELKSEGGDDKAFAAVEKGLGKSLVKVLMDTFPEPVNADDNFASAFKNMGESISGMDSDIKRLWSDAGELNPVLKKAPLDKIMQRDAHYHPTNYNGAINSLPMLVRYMDENNIAKTNAAALPSQLAHTSPELQYYAGAQSPATTLLGHIKQSMLGLVPDEQVGLRYRSHDAQLASDLQNMKDAGNSGADRILLSITGLDLTDSVSIINALDEKMRGKPGLYKSVGEVTLKKEIVSDLKSEVPEIFGESTLTLLDECQKRGLPLLIHCDRGNPTDKHLNADEFEAVLESWARKLHPPKNGMKPVGALAATIGTEVGVPAQGKVCWAHAAGLARFTPDAANHAKKLDALLSKEVLKPHLYADLSWDFTVQNIIQNVRDMLVNAGRDNAAVKPELNKISVHLDGLIKSYRAFSTAGGQSDKANDLGDLTQSALHRDTGSRAATLHLNQLSGFKSVVKDAIIANPDVGKVLTDLMTKGEHSEKENNWLKLFTDHSDRLMFGTDALAVGTKAHGEAAYAVNTKVLHPIYFLFLGLAEAVEDGKATLPQELRPTDVERGDNPQNGGKLRQIVKNIAEDTFADFYEDPKMEIKRTDFENHLIERTPLHMAGLPESRTIDVLESVEENVEQKNPAGTPSQKPQGQPKDLQGVLKTSVGEDQPLPRNSVVADKSRANLATAATSQPAASGDNLAAGIAASLKLNHANLLPSQAQLDKLPDGFQWHNPSRDGNCLFHALARQFSELGNHQDIRSSVAVAAESRGDDLGKFALEMATALRLPGEYTGDATSAIDIAANAYSIHTRVIMEDGTVSLFGPEPEAALMGTMTLALNHDHFFLQEQKP